MKRLAACLALLTASGSALLTASCGGGPSPAPPPRAEPERITVQHVLVSFAGTPRTKATRTKAEAETLATSLLDRARRGEDFDALMKQYSDDTGPGVYPMANHDARPGGPAGEYSRSGMVAAFGNVGFRLEPGEVGLAPFHPRESPFGWHLIKRLK